MKGKRVGGREMYKIVVNDNPTITIERNGMGKDVFWGKLRGGVRGDGKWWETSRGGII